MTGSPARLLLDSRCELGEGILWCERRHLLYWVDILACKLWCYEPASGHTHTWTLPQPLACIGLGEDGRLLLGLADGLYAADVDAHADASTLPLRKLVDVEADDPMTRVNDGRADRDGGFVFGTKSEHADNRKAGRFYQYTAAHGLRDLGLPAAAIPNSICFDQAGTRMYFCDSVEPRILCCDYDAASASISNVRVFVTLDTPGAEPDGSIIDAEGALWNAQWGAGQVVRYLPDGKVDRIVRTDAPQPSCVALRGDTLFITTARVGLPTRALAAQPASGGIFAHHVGRVLARGEDRVRLS
ncbi:MAG TPA: SMP-30/gluconolactonase/LRE family protein [Thermomonas sp.]|nr:SMP-30/gluconolactonase/LRE family protein [Thermomonas sp.]